MSRPEVTEGWTRVIKPTSRSLQSLPTFGLWKWVQEQRPSHVKLDADQNTILCCIGCGLMFSPMEMGDITVGAVIRMEKEEVTGHFETTVETKVMPTTRRGKGCSDCIGLYTAECSKVAEVNRLDTQLYNLKLAIAKINHISVDNYPPIPKPRVGWLNISDAVMEYRKDYMAWLDKRRELGLLKD